jgi:hypothetical protein
MPAASGPTLHAKVAFLSRPNAYPCLVAEVSLRETHMSLVFLAGERVYKLKKPLRSGFLDLSTCALREAGWRSRNDIGSCRRGFGLNGAYRAIRPSAQAS